jgi:hypothetical protein
VKEHLRVSSINTHLGKADRKPQLMPTSTLALLKQRAQAPSTPKASKPVTEYLADVPGLTHLGIGLVLTDPYLAFLEDVEDLIRDAISDHFSEEEILRISHQEYADRCQEDGFKAAISEVGSVPFLMLSDLWIAKSTAQAKFFNLHLDPLVNHRWRSNLPTVITSRNSAEALATAYPKFWPFVEDRNIVESLR